MNHTLRYQLQHYMNGKTLLSDLEDWLVANLQSILDAGDEKVIEVANEIDADLMEFRDGSIDEKTLLTHFEYLLNHLETVPVTEPKEEVGISTQATTSVNTIETYAEFMVPKPTDLRWNLQFA